MKALSRTKHPNSTKAIDAYIMGLFLIAKLYPQNRRRSQVPWCGAIDHLAELFGAVPEARRERALARLIEDGKLDGIRGTHIASYSSVRGRDTLSR